MIRMPRLLTAAVAAAGIVAMPALAAPDLIVINADTYTVDPRAPRVQAFAVEDGRFSFVGTTAQARALAGPATRVIDAAGRSVTPGFIDAHSHVTGDSPVVAGVDIAYVADKQEWLRRIKAADERLPKGEWIVGGNWDHTLSDGKYPTRQMLDAIVPDRPVFLGHVDGHYAWVNSRALEMASVNAKSRVPAGGEILLDAEGAPTGILLEGAMDLVSRIIPPRSVEKRHAGLATMYRYANSFGITGLHQMGALEEYVHVVESGDPTLRIWYGHWGPREAGAGFDAGVKAILATKADTGRRAAVVEQQKAAGPLLAIGFVKLINDGVLSAHTAVLKDDYSDRAGWRGEYITSPEELKTQVLKVTAAGLPVAVHSIGDAAVAATLDAYEAARGNPVPHPNRVEHVEIVLPGDVDRFRRLGVVASMQPNHATNSIGYVPQRVGAERENHAYVWKSMLDAGVPLVYGADYDTSPLDPLLQIADAVFRSSPFGFFEGKPWHPEQAVSFEQALHAYTQGPAGITAWKDQLGSISVGKWADFVVLDGTVPVPMDQGFRKLAVARTFFAGREVYTRP